MTHVAYLFLACILAGFALIYMPAISFLSSLTSLFHIIGSLAILVFALIIIYLGLKAIVKKL